MTTKNKWDYKKLNGRYIVTKNGNYYADAENSRLASKYVETRINRETKKPTTTKSYGLYKIPKGFKVGFRMPKF